MSMIMKPALRIAQLLALLKRVEGRKKIQKLVHILQELGYPFPERFEYSYYGMYSKELRAELNALTSESLVHERETANVFGSPQFLFESTVQLEKLLEEAAIEKEPDWAALAKRLNALSPQTLEGISTILFLHHRGVDGDELRRKFVALKPHFADSYDQCGHEARALLAEKAA